MNFANEDIYRRAASNSSWAPVIALFIFGIGAVVISQLEQAFWIPIFLGGLGLVAVILLFGFVAGLVAIWGLFSHGIEGVLWRALVGTLSPFVFVLLAMGSGYYLLTQAMMFDNAPTFHLTNTQKAVKNEAMKCIYYFYNEDFGTFATFLPPRVVDDAAVKKEVVHELQNTMKKMRANGVEILDIKVGNPQSPRELNGLTACLIPQRLILRSGNKVMEQDSFLVGLREYSDENWYFIDSSAMQNPAIELIYPGLKKALNVPETVSREKLP